MCRDERGGYLASKLGSIIMLIRIDTPFGSFVAKDEDLITEQLQKYGAHTRNELAMVKSFVSKDDVLFLSE